MKGTVQVNRGTALNRDSQPVRYEQRSDGWYIKVPGAREWQKFAQKSANERTVRQLIHKEFDTDYAVEPAGFGEFGGFSQ